MHDDLPVVDVVVACADGTSCRRLLVDVGQLLHEMSVGCRTICMCVKIAHLEDSLVLGHGERWCGSVSAKWKRKLGVAS